MSTRAAYMLPDAEKMLTHYQSGLITAVQLVCGLIEAATVPPKDEFLDCLPASIIEQIRHKVEHLEVTWRPGAIGTPDSSTETTQCVIKTRLNEITWYPGLAFWREYFGFTAEK